MAPKGTVRSLITIGSPYSFSQISPQEFAIFGDEDRDRARSADRDGV